MLSTEDYALLTEWYKSQEQLRLVTAHERELREKVVAKLFPNTSDGSYGITLHSGWEAKLVRSTTYKVETGPRLDAIVGNLRASQSHIFRHAPDAIFKWSPRVSASGWKDQPGEVQSMLRPVITTKQAAPQLKLEAPK